LSEAVGLPRTGFICPSVGHYRYRLNSISGRFFGNAAAFFLPCRIPEDKQKMNHPAASCRVVHARPDGKAGNSGLAAVQLLNTIPVAINRLGFGIDMSAPGAVYCGFLSGWPGLPCDLLSADSGRVIRYAATAHGLAVGESLR
jgi:hypothetical protein